MELVDLRGDEPDHNDIRDWQDVERMQAEGHYPGGPGNGFHSVDYPFVYHKPTDQLVVGPLGWYHVDMFRQHPDEDQGERLGREWLNKYSDPNWGVGGRLKPDGQIDFYGQDYIPGRVDDNQRSEIGRQLAGIIGRPTSPYGEAADPTEQDWEEEEPSMDWETTVPSESMGRFSANAMHVEEANTGKGDPLDPTWGIRRPFIVRGDTIHLGDLGTHHPWIARMIGSDMYFQDGTYQGMVWTQPSPDAYEGWLEWHNAPPEPQKSMAEQALAAAHPEYVWAPELAPSNPYEPDENDWDDDEDEPYGVLSYRMAFLAARGINVIQTADPMFGKEDHDPEFLNQRLSWIYHPPSQNLFLGELGYFHQNIKNSPQYRQAMQQHVTDHPRVEGWAYINDQSFDHEGVNYELNPHEEQNIKSIVEEKLGMPLTKWTGYPQEDWSDLMEN